MKTLALSEILQAIDGTLIKGNQDAFIEKVVRKFNNIDENSLYFFTDKKGIDLESLEGKNGYFIVIDKVNDMDSFNEHTQLILVNNCKEAYWKFIDYYRGLFDIPVIGITGTCGKTTTKDMISHVLKKILNVHKTYLSQNGLYFNLSYLMGLNEDTEAAVFEMGVAYKGNVRSSGKYFKPTVGVITNIGEAHLEGCKTLEKYIMAKGEMLEALSNKGKLIVNGDDENIKKIDMTNYKGEIIPFGINKDAQFKASQIEYANGGMSYTLLAKGTEYDVFVPGYGEHNIYNSLAAIAACDAIGVPIDACIKLLQSFRTMHRHVKIYKGLKQSFVIDDTWNCNPSSVKSALQVLKNISNGKKEILVLGKMQRLGNQLKEQHMKMGKTLMDIGGVDMLITVGDSAKLTGLSAIESGMEASKVIVVQNAEELDSLLDRISDKDSCILFKMSLGKMKKDFHRVVAKYRGKTTEFEKRS